jgi:hypothetical protein
VFCRYSTIYTVGVETVKLFDKDGHGRVVIVKQKSVLSLDKDSIKKSSGTKTSARKFRSQNSYISKYPPPPSFPCLVPHLHLSLVSRNSFAFDDESSVSSSGSVTQKKVLLSPPLFLPILHTIFQKAPLSSPAVAKIDKIIQAISTDPPQVDRAAPMTRTKAVVPDHLWNTRYLRHHRPSSPNTIYRFDPLVNPPLCH